MNFLNRALVAAVAVVSLSFSVEAFAQFEQVVDLQPVAGKELAAYLKKDIACQGNARSVGIDELRVLRHTKTGETGLSALIWANSCQMWKENDIKYPAYGSKYDKAKSINANMESCGLIFAQFYLPIMWDGKQWNPRFDAIQKTALNPAAVALVVERPLEQEDDLMTRYGISMSEWSMAEAMYQAARYNPMLKNPKIDIKEVFEKVKKHLPQQH